ncbi:MAG: hypothetical protein ACLTW9_30725 [Enterocloster sp.]
MKPNADDVRRYFYCDRYHGTNLIRKSCRLTVVGCDLVVDVDLFHDSYTVLNSGTGRQRMS